MGCPGLECLSDQALSQAPCWCRKLELVRNPPAKACCACQLLQQCKRYRRGPLGSAGQAAGALGRTSPPLVGRGYPTRSAIGAGWRVGKAAAAHRKLAVGL